MCVEHCVQTDLIGKMMLRSIIVLGDTNNRLWDKKKKKKKGGGGGGGGGQKRKTKRKRKEKVSQCCKVESVPAELVVIASCTSFTGITQARAQFA